MADEKRIILYVLRKLRGIPNPGPATQALLTEVELANRILERIPSYRWDDILPAVFPLKEDETPESAEEGEYA